ncbi:hypothetical protein HYQ46_000214 [Verticillium longisporum]|nr:hypothetical protein HYQ46_000214 [Verticillium longisporum]
MVLDAIELGLGAATSAADLTLAIVKLKQLWDEVKDVPNEIASILENLEAFGLMLQDLEARLRIDDIPPELRSRIVASPPQLFQRAYASLQDVIGSLNMELQKSNGSRRRFASIKIVLQKSTLQLLEKKLQQALQTFAWAIQIFQLSLMVKAEHMGSEVSLRTYCLIPKWAPIFDDELHMVFIEDDFSAVKRSLHTHGLPIWSQDMTGLSLLALATIYQSPKILRQLFKIGLKSTSDLVNYFAEHVLDLVGPESTNFITEIYLQLTQLYLLLDSAFTDLGKPQQRRLDTFHITSDYIPSFI